MADLGVYFRREDYAPFWLRVVIDIVDGATFGIWCIAVGALAFAINASPRTGLNAAVLLWVVSAFLYFVILKRSSFRTLGYRICEVKVVALDGGVPSYGSLFLRVMFSIFSPLNWLDLIWLSSDPHRQALRDKFANTYVVKTKAQAVGGGRVILRPYEILFFNFLFREVEKSPAPK